MPAKEMSAKNAAKVEAKVREALAAVPTIPGAWIGVWDPKKGAYLGAFGDAATGGAATTTADSFRIGSITKSFTAVVILSLIAGGELALTDTIAERLPALAAKYPQVADITIQQLLSMTSGITDYANVPTNGIVPQAVANPSRVFTADELITAGIEGGVTPGTTGYSTTNYIILGEIAEAVTGTPIEALIAERVTKPLGLNKTVLPAPESTSAPQPQSRGYVIDSAELVSSGAPAVPTGTDVTDWNSWGQAGGGMWSTLEDLGAFAASESGNSLLPKKLAKARLKTKTVQEGLDYGLGIIKWGPWVGHQGEALGYETWALHNTKTGVTYVGVVNACCGDVSLASLAPLLALYPKDAEYLLG
ncbi:MAG: serine hydrolase domain-containing protein [Actinomycetota bacterium]